MVFFCASLFRYIVLRKVLIYMQKYVKPFFSLARNSQFMRAFFSGKQIAA